jgi:hypothetical protein
MKQDFDILENPDRPLSADEQAHFDELMVPGPFASGDDRKGYPSEEDFHKAVKSTLDDMDYLLDGQRR